MRFLRRLQVVPQAGISRAEAEAIAMQECERRGWPWEEPVHIGELVWEFHIMTNSRRQSGNANIWVHRRDGVVTGASYSASKR
jgi:hypothetical protein